LELPGRGPGRSIPDRLAVELDDWHHLADGRGREGLVRRGHVVEREDAFAHLVPRGACLLEERRPRDAGEDPQFERRRVQHGFVAPTDGSYWAFHDESA